MSVKQKGPSRIPKFGSRILVRSQREKDSPTSEINHQIEKHMHILNETQLRPEKEQIQEEIRILNNGVIKSNRELKTTDLGRRVRLNNKEGILRFLGNVHFAPGIWAGVEVSKGLGKNDGHVRGCRYFACPDDCGLLASSSKVTLIEDDDEASGPHSMIFGVNQENIMEAENENNREIISCDKTSLASSQPSSKTKCFEESCDKAKDQSCNISCKNEDPNRTFVFNQNCEVSEVLEKKPEDKNNTFVSQRTFVKEENATFCKQEDKNRTFVNQPCCDKGETTFCKEDPNNVTVIRQEPLVKENTTFTKAERKCIIRDQTVDIPNSSYLNDSVGEEQELCNNNIDSSLNETLKPMNDIIKKRPFLLENLIDYSSPSTRYSQFHFIQQQQHSTPIISDFESPSWKVRLSPSHLEDESNKRDSLEFEESLGILTPDQMIDASGFVGSRTPSSENIRDFIKFQTNDASPKIESSVNDFSLGIIDEHVLSALTTKLDIVMDLDLREDAKNRILNRIEQTPSPEDLPLDPLPIQKIDQQKKTTSSFITSITSITSLDTGYQGDGEMSRPASRADENSALTRRQPRRPDPMTDSDFYTESDADNHDDNQTRGDRKAQVIDGTLYGVDPQAAADIYANNRENMDSSGIFTDIETRTEELQNLSPSDSSTKTLSDDSQTNVNLITNKTPTIETFLNENNIDTSNLETPSPVSTVASGPTSSKTSKSKDDTPIKKYKMPKRNVASKVKAMLEPSNKENEKKITPVKKTAGRWDAVMNKISKTPDSKNFKEVKSKVFTSHPPNVQRNNDVNKLNVSNKSPNNKIRKVRSRATTNVSSNKNAESINSSLSDLSGASPAKKNATTKKQREVVRVNQVLTSSKLPTKLLAKPNNHAANTEAKNKNNTNLNNEVKAAANRNLFSAKDKKKDVTKEIGRATVKGGRVSPGTRPPPQARAPQKPAPRTAEALAVLVQHLVFNLEAFKNPTLKKEVDRMRLNAEEAQLSCRLLEETLTEEKQRHIEIINEERVKYRAEIGQLIEKHRNELIKVNLEKQEINKTHQHEKEKMRETLMKSQEDKIRTFKIEYEKLQKTHEESLDILREENDAIREEIDEKNMRIRELEAYRCENAKLRRDYELKEISYKERLAQANEEIARLREENGAFYNSQNLSSDNSLQEVHSLRAVLELKQSECADLRKALAEAGDKADDLRVAEEKISSLMAKCEILQHQLERKNDYELQIISENKKLNESLKEEMNQKSRILQHNEELQWKLQQNKEVVSKVLEEASVSSPLSRSILSASFNERTLSFRERSLSNKSNGSQCSNKSRKSKTSLEIDTDELSPPSSPVVKGVVKKSDSVSYVLEMDESPEIVASRIVRRSFRNTPTKSPANKRQKNKNALSLSSSTSALIRSSEDQENIFWDNQVTSTPNAHKYYGDFDEDLVDITLPALPSEIGRKVGNTLPVPKHLAGEAMISESNSEDECSTSSSSGQL